MKHCGVVTDRSWIDPEPDSMFSGASMWNELLRNGNVKGFPVVVKAQKRRIYSDEVPMASEKQILGILQDFTRWTMNPNAWKRVCRGGYR